MKTLAELLNNFKTLVDSWTYDQASQKESWITYYSGVEKNLQIKIYLIL